MKKDEQFANELGMEYCLSVEAFQGFYLLLWLHHYPFERVMFLPELPVDYFLSL
jgi:hypothetical protein